MTDLATRTVGVAGTGRLAASVRAAVARPAPADPGSCALVLAVGDGWGSDHAALDAACRAAGTPWLPVRVEPGVVVIGPLVRPGVPGCASCAQARRRAARHD